jgi:hypothetical protein
LWNTSAIWVQPETPILRQEVPHDPADAPDELQEMPDDLQETPDDLQEYVDNPQDTSQVRQVDYKMTKYSWRDLSFDKEANTQLLEHFCRRGTSEKDPTKPGKSALLQLLLKNMVPSGELVIDRSEEGVPILSRGQVTQVAHVSEDVATATQETDPRVESSQYQSQQDHAQQTPSQLGLANARLAKMAYEKATRIAQERMQEAAQEVKRIKQETTAASRKAKKAERYRATMEKLEKLPPCPKLCRGEECSGIPCQEEEPGYYYSHIADMVVCHDKAHVSMATMATSVSCSTCGQQGRDHPNLHLQHDLRQDLLQKNLGGGTSGARHASPNRGNQKTGKPGHAGKGQQQQQL